VEFTHVKQVSTASAIDRSALSPTAGCAFLSRTNSSRCLRGITPGMTPEATQ
jgi:hypothetical protein